MYYIYYKYYYNKTKHKLLADWWRRSKADASADKIIIHRNIIYRPIVTVLCYKKAINLKKKLKFLIKQLLHFINIYDEINILLYL